MTATVQASTAASGLPFKPPGADVPATDQWLTALLLCAAVLAVILIGVKKWLALRGGAVSPAERAQADIRVLSSARLSPQQRLVAVAWRGKQLLLAVSAQGVTVVGSDVDTPGPGTPP